METLDLLKNIRFIFVQGMQNEIDKSIFELEALQQHIKSLEAQLANTEQLKCETCKFRNCLASEIEPCSSCLIKLGYGNHYQPKDTQ